MAKNTDKTRKQICTQNTCKLENKSSIINIKTMPRVDCVKLEMGAFKLNMCHFSDGSPYYYTGQEGVEIWMDFSWIKIFLGYSDVLTIVRGKSFAKLSRKCSLSSKRKFFY